jgi:hypothetical protein
MEMRNLFLVLFITLCFIVTGYFLNADVGSNYTGVADDETKAQAIIDIEHLKIHEGDHYTACNYDADVDAAKIWRITSPDTSVRIHLKGRISSSLNGVVQLYKNPTLTGNGTSFNSYNNNGNSSNTTSVTFGYDATASNNGTLVYTQVIGTDGTNPNGSSGGFIEQGEEFILSQNEDYLLIYTPQSENQRVSVCFEYYEIH